jgi:hypothetical protein
MAASLAILRKSLAFNFSFLLSTFCFFFYIVGQTGLNVLNQGFADVSACGLDRWAIAEATLQPRAIGQIPLVFGLLLDHHFKIEELHAGTVGD